MFNNMILIREREKITQEEMAKSLNVSRSTYSMWEEGNDNIPLNKILKFCSLYNISVDYFFDFNSVTNYKQNKCNLNIDKSKKRLKELRKEQNLTQKSLTSKIGIGKTTLSDYETGKSNISTLCLYAICLEYNISADYLLGKIDTPKYLNSPKK